MNTYIRDNQNALDGGRLSVTSQAARDIFFASSSTALSRLAAGTDGYFLKTRSTGSDPVWAEVSTKMSVHAKSASYAVLTSDGDDAMFVVDSSGGSVTLTLYAASGQSGGVVRVKRTSASNDVILDGNAAETIDGAATFTMIQAAQTSNSIVCDGTAWHNF